MKRIKIGNQSYEVISSVNAIGLFCPLPVVKLKLELEDKQPNQVVEILADDPAISEDLPHWCRETNNKLLSLEKTEDGIFVAYVQKQGN